MAALGNSLLETAVARGRIRSSWNDRLAHWERPASTHEEAKIERAAAQARAIVAANQWLTTRQVQVLPQGSYFNNTNVRLEADMDLRILFPEIKTVYLDGLDPASTDERLGYFSTGEKLNDIAAKARKELETDLVSYYGRQSVSAGGNKAITVNGLSGTRVDCDLVPAFRLHVVSKRSDGSPGIIEGVAILGKDGSWTLNFPDLHHANGKAKRFRTAHRFKKCVRMLKQLNYELANLGEISKRMPSFFVECLVYGVEDVYFLVETDDRYDRLKRILNRMLPLLYDAAWVQNATEINEVKYLFRDGQAWDHNGALAFVRAAIARLES
ncbi:MAG: hypothetical protein V4633_20335 [Pseudomonadota bacterium]